MEYLKITAAILAAWNLTVFAAYGIDKDKAKRGSRRISENTLLMIAAFMGGLGAFLGMCVFRHKTRHIKFKISVPLLLAINVIMAILCIRGFDMQLGDNSAVYVIISAKEALAMMDNEASVILDVRTEEEFTEAHIENAVLIPDYELSSRAESELPDKNTIILIYCRSGRRSELAAKELIKLGYRNVYDFGGIIDWPYDTVSGIS